MNLTEAHLKFFGLAMIFYVVVAGGFGSFFDLVTQEAKKNTKAPIISLQFVRRAGDVEAITKNNPHAKEGLKTALLFDTFAFVPLYFGFLLLMSFLLSETSLSYAKTAAVVVVLASIIAAAADWTENYYSYKALDTVFSSPEDSVITIFLAANIKWALIFIATGILSAIFWRGGWWNIAAGLMLVSSLTGLVGLIIYRPLITLSLLIQLLVLFVVGIVFMFSNCRLSFLRSG